MFSAWSSSPGRRGLRVRGWVRWARSWPGTCWRESGTTNAFTGNDLKVRPLAGLTEGW